MIESWILKAIELHHTKPWDVVTQILKGKDGLFQDRELNNTLIDYVKHCCHKYLRENQSESPIETMPNDRVVDIITNKLQKGTTIEELQKLTGLSNSLICVIVEEIKAKGYNVLQLGEELKIGNIIVPENNVVNREWKGEKIVRFGLMGDTHIGSIFTQLGLLHKAYEIFKQEGITDVYHTGDITEGENMRPGHAYECYVHGADQHVAEVIKNYPKIDGITTHFIDGNHDASFIKHAGLSIGKLLTSQRPDMVYLGHSQATINLTPNCILELRHPSGGSAYAISYKAQKIVEALFGGTKPNILAFGHYHKMEYLFYRNIHTFQTGTLQGQSNFMRDLGLAAHMGFWIITVHVGEDGGVDRISPEMYPFYQAVENDWKNWR